MKAYRALGSLALFLGLLLAPVNAAIAGDDDGWGSGETEHGTEITGQQGNDTQDVIDHSIGDDGTYTPPTQWPEYKYVPTCSINAPEGGADVLCGAAVNTCDAMGETGAIRFWVYRRTIFADGRKPTAWDQVATVCKGPDDPMPTTPVVTTEMVVQVARALAPKTQPHVEPATQSYVNIPNNYYADAPDVTRTVNLFGHSIAVRFTGGETTWDFGDGNSATGTGIEGAEVGQAGSVEHGYDRKGEYSVTVSTAYDVSFTLPDGQAVTQQVTGVPGPAAQLQIGEIQTTVNDVG
ncbi:hypothetical protein [Nocardioides sp. Root151]|uniref:hypothetical protein n=1 Tax=Nocardioides sp. Root151 TaxID=1736475 RepID=UPI0007029510|nr:hypothetical protein [Nocardioides sp. Root151]KQZ75469.1 hypothetical protein ASD66_03685 [Nocardioides sp. Root151]